MTIHQDALLYGSTLEAGEEAAHAIAPGRGVWLQVARGSLSVNGLALEQGDGAAVSEEKEMLVKADSACEFLLFNLAWKSPLPAQAAWLSPISSLT